MPEAASGQELWIRGVRPCERVEKGLCSLQISRVDAFGEAVVDRMEERHGISGTALIAQQLGEARSGGSSQERAPCRRAPVERLPEVILGHRRGSGWALQQKQLPLT